MSSIFSTQNLHTFLRRKNLRPPPSRGGPPGPRPPPPNRGRSPPDRGPSLERGRSLGADCSAAFVSSAIILLFVGRPVLRHPIPCHCERSEEFASAQDLHEPLRRFSLSPMLSPEFPPLEQQALRLPQQGPG